MLVVLVLVGNLTTEQHQTTTSMVTGTVHEAIAADQLQHAITSTHARVYRTLLWSSMDVEVVDPRAVADEIRTELSLIQAHGLDAATTNGSEDGRLKLVMTINEKLRRYTNDVGELLEMAAVDPAMATLMMSRAERNVNSLSEDLAKLLTSSKSALVDDVPVLLAQQAEERSVGHQIIVVALVVSLIVSIIATRSITDPMRRLTRAMGRARKGNVDAFLDAATNRTDEIGAMSRAFSELEHERKATSAALRKSHEELESLVDARTSELARTNRELREQIAERKAVEAALRRGEQEHRHILDGSLQGVMMLRSDHIIYANDALAKMLGFSSADEVLSVPSVLQLIEPEFHPVLLGRHQARLRGEAVPANHEFKMRTRDKRIITVLNSARTVDWHGQQVTMCFVVDMTAREAARLSAEKMRDDALATARAKSEFLANMSHEIRTPMNGVIGAIALLEDTSLNEEQKKLAAIARVSGGALIEVIDNVLDLSKIDAGHLALEAIDLKPRDIIEDVIDMCAERAFSKHVDIYCVEAGNPPEWVVGDPSRLRQVFTNLVANAVKFTLAGHIEIRLTHDGENLIVAIEDTGVGMAPETLGRVFEAFVQEDSTTTRRFGGTGLGLTICHKIVTAMRGRIEVESTPHVGTTFTVCVPAPKSTNGQQARVLCGRQIALECNHIGLLRDLASLLQDRWGAKLVARLEGQNQPPDCRILVEADDSTTRADEGPEDAHTPTIAIARNPSGSRGTNVCELRRPVRAQALLEAIEAKLHSHIPARDEPIDVAAERPLAGLRVLVVDDVTVNRLIACKMLETMGAQPAAIKNGAEAVAYICAQTTDLVLMDCQMPVMDGYEATRSIRRLVGASANVPVIAQTAHAMHGADTICLEAGMNDYMSKPLSPETLLQKLKLWAPAPLLAPEHVLHQRRAAALQFAS